MENKEEFQKKAEAFIAEYGELVKKHKIDLAHIPVYLPDEKGGFVTTIRSYPVVVKEEEFVAKEE